MCVIERVDGTDLHQQSDRERGIVWVCGLNDGNRTFNSYLLSISQILVDNDDGRDEEKWGSDKWSGEVIVR